MFLGATHNRKKSSELIAVQRYTQQTLSCDYCTSDVSNIAKNYGRLLINSTAVSLLDVLFQCLNRRVLREGDKPIVYPSNNYLCDRLTRSKSGLQKLMRKLSEHGLIAYCDSPNGKRYKNDRTGETFGIDLTPMFEREDELRELVKQEHKRLKQERELKRKIREFEKSLNQFIDDVRSKALTSQFAVHLQACCNIEDQAYQIKHNSSDLQQRFEAFEILHSKAEELFIEVYTALKKVCVENIEESAKSRPKGIPQEAHQYNTNSPHLNDVCTKTRACSVAPQRAVPARVFEAVRPEQKALAALEASLAAFEKEKWEPHERRVFENPVLPRRYATQKSKLTFGLVKSAITEVQAVFGEVNSFTELVDLVPKMKLSMQLHQHAINTCLKTHGFQYLAVCLAITLEKHLRAPSLIRNTAGYAVALFKLDNRSGSTKITRTLKHLAKSCKPDNVSEVLAV